MQRILITVLVSLVTVGFAVSTAVADVARMTTDELQSRLDDSEVVILDARGSWDWVKTDDKIIGADRVDPGSVSVWAKNYDNAKTFVIYCA